MEVVSFTEARNNLKTIFDKVYYDNEEVIMTRKNSQSVVMITLDEYNSMKETNYLLSSPKNKERLLGSLNSSREGKLSQKELIEK
jgi:antitoxin YefM